MDPSGRSGAPSVLVVDDNPDDLIAFERAVRGRGYRLETAESGRLGLSKAVAGRHDLIVLDYNLGDMTGTEVLLRLKEADHAQPVLIQSGIGSHFVVARALALGADGFIAKDSANYAEEVRNKVDHALARRLHPSMRPAELLERQPMTELEHAIDDLVERSHGTFNAVGFSSPDGFRITTRIRRPGSLTAETICAMIASATSTSRFLGEGLGSTQLRVFSAEFDDSVLWSAPVNNYGYLFAVAPTAAGEPVAARKEFELAVREVGSLLASLLKLQKYSY